MKDWRRPLRLPTTCMVNCGVACEFVFWIFKQRSVMVDSWDRSGKSVVPPSLPSHSRNSPYIDVGGNAFNKVTTMDKQEKHLGSVSEDIEDVLRLIEKS